ncbi:MAG: RNB domain-containing ribonuclease, partial [Chromatiaceae bacterium]|nr:RNB domain-containing ribonuclease [Chromatiaceae bacterium]
MVSGAGRNRYIIAKSEIFQSNRAGNLNLSIHQANLRVDSLVLYKGHPARVLSLGEKIEIGLDKGEVKRVRLKDIDLLHPGPLRSLNELTQVEGAFKEAWELLEGGTTQLRELAELLYGDFSPASAWAAWRLVAEGLWFSGTPGEIQARTRQQVAVDQAQRGAKETAARDWADFLARLTAHQLRPEDAERLAEVERLARGRSEHSRILKALGHPETPESAHRALIQFGFWAPGHNPHPARHGLPEEDPHLPVGQLPEEERLDLTHLPAFAIDDEGNQDPDDALSLEGDRLWVHVADVAALIPPDSEMDREARARGGNQYLPERMVNMLPLAITQRLGLGLQEISPAISFGFGCDEAGEVRDVTIQPTWVRVERLSYEVAEGRLEEPPFAAMGALVERFRHRRQANDAASIELPEVSLRVRDGEVVIRSLPRLRSRALVMDAMLMAGEAVAAFCRDQGIPIPYVTQPAPDKVEQPTDMAGMYAYRRRFKPSRLVGEPGPHFGLGLPIYTRATSPLRRYSDLLVHQQLRAWLRGEVLIEAQAVAARVGEAEAVAVAIRRSERLSNQHWKLVWLRDHPDWWGEALVVDRDERKHVLLIPDLALETRVRLQGDPALN